MNILNEIIPVTDTTEHCISWQQELRQAIKCPDELIAMLNLTGNTAFRQKILRAHQQFPLRVTRHFVSKMAKGDPTDPLLAQVMPLISELDAIPGYTADPLAERDYLKSAGLIHKYKGRALLVATGACAIHCRYCFRRHFQYSQGKNRLEQAAIDYINTHQINELILSGGDPLMLSNNQLHKLSADIAEHTNVSRLRVHTRMPAILPSRFDKGFISWWNTLPFDRVMVLHINHPEEIDQLMLNHLRMLDRTLLLNQTVLLRGVNDSETVLTKLFDALSANGIRPYYLHQLDQVAGAAAFQVDDDEAIGLIQAVRANLPGYMLPQLVRDVAGKPSKQPLEMKI